MTRVFVRRCSDSLTCPLQVTDDHFVAQIARVVAPFVSQLRPLHSDWCNSRLLALIDRAEPFHSYIQCKSLKDTVCTRAITASDFSIRKEFTLNTIKIFHFKITQLSSISVHCDKPKCVAGLINICLWLIWQMMAKNMCTTLFIGTGLKNQVSDGLYCWNPCLPSSSLLLHFLCRCISTLALFFFFFCHKLSITKIVSKRRQDVNNTGTRNAFSSEYKHNRNPFVKSLLILVWQNSTGFLL